MKLTIVRGIPGSGKSSLAEKLEKLGKSNTIICEADQFFIEEGKYWFDYKFLGDAHKWCQSKCAYYLFKGYDVIVSNTSIHYKDINTYYKIALKYKADFSIVNCTEQYGNIHEVSEDVLERMKNKFKVITTEEWIKHKEMFDDNNEGEYF